MITLTATKHAREYANRDQQEYRIYRRQTTDRPLQIGTTGRAIFAETITIFVKPGHEPAPEDADLINIITPTTKDQNVT